MNDPHQMGPGVSAALVRALAAGAATGYDLLTFNAMPDGPLDERPITVDQTNLSVVVGERAVVKWMRRPMRDARAPRILGHLTEVGFTRMPTPYAAAYRDGALVALVTAYLPDAVDGWDWCVEDLLGSLGDKEPDFPASLGVLAADLHAALATPSSVFATPLVAGTNPGWAAAGRKMLAEATQAITGTEDEAFFRKIEPHLAAQIDKSDTVERARFMHIHGDLHAGQVLRWRGGLAVIDFDGNPTVAADAMEPAARDVAQLRTSILHVGEIANRRSEGRYQDEIRAWARLAIVDTLDAYRDTLCAHGALEVFDDPLLRPFEYEQECRELVYAARFLPRWQYAPMGVLRDWHRGVA